MMRDGWQCVRLKIRGSPDFKVRLDHSSTSALAVTLGKGVVEVACPTG
jgi:hypothetical protein